MGEVAGEEVSAALALAEIEMDGVFASYHVRDGGAAGGFFGGFWGGLWGWHFGLLCERRRGVLVRNAQC